MSAESVFVDGQTGALYTRNARGVREPVSEMDRKILEARARGEAMAEHFHTIQQEVLDGAAGRSFLRDFRASVVGLWGSGIIARSSEIVWQQVDNYRKRNHLPNSCIPVVKTIPTVPKTQTSPSNTTENLPRFVELFVPKRSGA